MGTRIDEKTWGMTLIVAGSLWLALAGMYSAWRASETPDPGLSRHGGSSVVIPENHQSHPLKELLPPPQKTTALPATSRLACQVVIVYDGDTLGCDLNRNRHIDRPEEEIRLLGIDSPEMHYSRKNRTFGTDTPKDEPFAAESSRWLTRQALGKTIYLEFDRREYDRYGRRLAYVYVGQKEPRSLNEQSLANGYSKLLFMGKNRRYQVRFEQAERDARNTSKGLWRQP